MQIFKREQEDGLEEIIKANASVSYASALESGSPKGISAKAKKELKSIAGISDNDLYYTQSVLVTTSWNKNDDIFSPEEVWAAKDSPVHKPTNLEHDEKTIVGHITANWPITVDGILIDKDTPVENLPEKFHILTASVIYKGFTEPDLRERTQKLISEIEDGTKYVSMECFFQGFDYGLTNIATGEFNILERNEETAFLTKHLRSYGGMGVNEGYRIGRVLRNITFTGKGFVDKPANPESVIFSRDEFFTDNEKTLSEKKDSFSDQGVFSNQANLSEEVTVMSDPTKLEETKVEAMNDCSKLVEEAYASRDEYKTKASELEVSVKAEQELLADAKAAIEALEAEKEEAAKKMEDKEEEMKKMKADLDAALESLAAYKDKEEEMKKKEEMMKKKAALVEAGLDEEAAEASLEKFESLDDVAFEGIVSLLAAMKPKMPPAEDDPEMDKKEKKDGKPKASEETKAEEISEVLETAEPEAEVDLSVGSDEASVEVESTRAALVDFVYNRLGKTLNK